MVRIFLVVFLLVGLGTANDGIAQTVAKDATATAQEQLLNKDNKCYDDAGLPTNTPKCNQIMQAAQSANSDDCLSGATKRNYNKARETFSTACGQAGVPTDGHPSVGTNIACGYKMASCNCLGGKSSFAGITCSGKKVSTSAKSTVPSAAEADQNNQDCPALASKDSAPYEKELDKLEDKTREDEDKINDLQKDALKAHQDAQQKIDDAADKKTEAQSKYDEDLEKAQKDKTDAQKQIMDQINQLQTQVQGVDEQISQENLAISSAYIKRDQAKTQVDLNCHQQALATVSKFQQQALQLQQEGRLNLGGQREILKKVGLSDRQHWEALAGKYYTWCLQSMETAKAKEDLNKSATQEVAAHKVAIANANKRKALLVQQIGQLKDPSGNCGTVQQMADGSSNQSQMCQQMQQAVATQQRMAQALSDKLKSIDRQAASAATNMQQSDGMASQQVQRAQNRLNEDTTRATNLREFLASNRAASGGSKDDKAYSNVWDKYGEFNTAAAEVVACDDQLNKGQCDKSPCVEAKRYLTMVGQDGGSSGAVAVATPPTTSAPVKSGSNTTPTGGGGDTSREDNH